jgi:hypothetical protein
MEKMTFRPRLFESELNVLGFAHYDCHFSHIEGRIQGNSSQPEMLRGEISALEQNYFSVNKLISDGETRAIIIGNNSQTLSDIFELNYLLVARHCRMA